MELLGGGGSYSGEGRGKKLIRWCQTEGGVTVTGTSFPMPFGKPVSSAFPRLKPWQGSHTLKLSSGGCLKP